MKTYILSLVLIFGCGGDEKKPELTKSDGKDIVQTFLLAVEKYPDTSFEKYLTDDILNSEEFQKHFPSLQGKWKLKNPGAVTITSVKNTISNGISYAKVVGTFKCEGSSHVSDLDFTFRLEEQAETWKIIDFKFEEC